jgi:hypothetical protein
VFEPNAEARFEKKVLPWHGRVGISLTAAPHGLVLTEWIYHWLFSVSIGVWL